MSQITETALFEACIQKPRSNLKIASLNLDKVKDPKNVAAMSKETIKLQKATRLFHMVWSGITKYIKTMVVARSRAVELTDIGIFVPTREPLQTQRLTNATLSQLSDQKDNDIKLYIFKTFLEQSNIKLSQNPLLEEFDPSEPMD